MIDRQRAARFMPSSAFRLIAALVAWRARLSARRVGLVVYYHSIGPTNEDPRDQLVPAVGARLFRQQLQYLRRHYRVVSLDGLIQAAARREPGDPFPIAITFDDDLASHRSCALPELRRQNVPATFFLCGASLHGRFSFWWEDLQRATTEQRNSIARLVSPHQSEVSLPALAAQIERMPPSERDAVAAALRELVGPPDKFAGMSAGDVAALARAGFDIGFHTRHHYLLSTLDDVTLHRELREGVDELATFAGKPPTSLAYPHGERSRRLAAAAQEAGFRQAFTCFPSPVSEDSDQHLLGRIEASSYSVGHLAFRTARAALRGEPRRN